MVTALVALADEVMQVPHNRAFVALGTGMLWMGWFGGSESISSIESNLLGKDLSRAESSSQIFRLNDLANDHPLPPPLPRRALNM